MPRARPDHPSIQRLLQSAQLATAKSRKPVTNYAELGAALEESAQTINNWKGERGVSKLGAIKGAERFHCTTAWILEGRGQPQGVERLNHRQVVDTAQHAHEQPAALSERSLSIAERLDALTDEARQRAYWVVDLALSGIEAEEKGTKGSTDAKRRSRKA